ncbi:MAG: N-acetyl-gamma-glutamyl-phosphate reductase [Proteobacteria bacterium]|nr:N-acetyl-gamma-glutamyl-phosphate reductase [Cystobacterineae bacterium]MCL2313776.1 N-acetyl-gamma-glutamyl-phosphate reductase [Pseudomonadota bacterium]
MKTVSIGVIGGSGYSGMELLRLLSGHPGFRVVFATSERWEGRSLREKIPNTHALGDLAFCSMEAGLAQLGQCQVVATATPAETSLATVPVLLKNGVRVVDLAGSFRLRDAHLYPAYYAFEHTEKALLGEAVYGLTELFRSDIPKATLLANPGCYATAAAMAVAPFLKKQLLAEDTLVINAASGVSGAGRRASEDYSYMEIAGDFRAYRIRRPHQHRPEIAQTLARVAQRPVDLVFSPHLLPIKRGILCTVFAKTKPGTSQAHIEEALEEVFGGEPLVEVHTSPEDIRIASVAHRPHLQVAACVEGEKLIVLSALDNLLKGAASQALQNLNLMFGYPETLGLLYGEK